MGGIVAMEIYSQEPNRIEKLILMDTNPKAELDEVKLKREPQIREVNKGKLLEVMRDEMKPNYLAESENQKECSKYLYGYGVEPWARCFY